MDAQASKHLEGLRTSDASVPEDAEVGFTGTIECIDGGYVADGDVSSSWAGECRRCLGDAGGPIVVAVREMFEKTPTEGETYGVDGDDIDLEPMVREAVMLELPTAPLCKPDCAGLCGQCGANRNEADCGHTTEVKDDRWAALDALKDQLP